MYASPAVLDVQANKEGTKVMLNDDGNSTSGDGPDVNVLNANIGCCGGDNGGSGDKMPAGNQTVTPPAPTSTV